MRSHDSDQEKPFEEKANQTFAQKVEGLQERVRKMGVVLDGSDDKAFMDETWGEDSGNTEGRGH
jgi:hypothetical protein